MAATELCESLLEELLAHSTPADSAPEAPHMDTSLSQLSASGLTDTPATVTGSSYPTSQCQLSGSDTPASQRETTLSQLSGSDTPVCQRETSVSQTQEFNHSTSHDQSQHMDTSQCHSGPTDTPVSSQLRNLPASTSRFSGEEHC